MQNVNFLDLSCTYYTYFPQNICIVRIYFKLQAIYKYAKSGFPLTLAGL